MEVDTAHSLQLSSRRLNLPRNSKHPEETEQIVKKREKGGMVCAKASCKKYAVFTFSQVIIIKWRSIQYYLARNLTIPSLLKKIIIISLAI